ncbi:MAG TPA: hypothetical protein VLA12_12495, partial [Planctomycetaceae bacterium]|nr:hypothetical protein [Planctomycetaceae bacterium]
MNDSETSLAKHEVETALARQSSSSPPDHPREHAKRTISYAVIAILVYLVAAVPLGILFPDLKQALTLVSAAWIFLVGQVVSLWDGAFVRRRDDHLRLIEDTQRARRERQAEAGKLLDELQRLEQEGGTGRDFRNLADDLDAFFHHSLHRKIFLVADREKTLSRKSHAARDIDEYFNEHFLTYCSHDVQQLLRKFIHSDTSNASQLRLHSVSEMAEQLFTL